MEFSDLAAKETSALLTRVLGTASQASLQRVDALRAALETATKSLEDAIAATPNVDGDVDDLAKRLTKAAAADADARLKHLSGEARKITDALRAELAEVFGAKEALVGEKEALAISLKDSRTLVDTVRGELQVEQKQVQAIQKQLAEAGATLKKLEAAKADAAAARDKEAAARAAAETELQSLRGQADSGRKEAKRAAADLEAALADKRQAEVALNAATSQAQAAEAKLSAVTTLFKTSAARVQALEREQEQHAAALRDLETRLRTSDDVEAEAPQSAVMLDGLLGAFDALSTAMTIGDVLATLGEQLAAEFPRVALFRVKGNRLEGAHQIGFDLTNDIGKVMIPLAMDSLLTRAVTSGRTERLSGDALVDTSGLPFGGSPTFALAMPIVVDGEAIAIVYADDFAEPRVEARGADDVKVKFAEALRHHTVSLLMRLTSELKALAELRAYAGSLLTEIEQMYDSDVSAGKEGEELKKRLLANLDYARSIYANRAQFESPAASALLDAQLGAMVDSHRDSAFGHDLAVVIDWSSGSRAAEAS
jgi:hypothetical protein